MLLDDWKKARKESDNYHSWRKGRELSLDEMNKDSELFEIQNTKFRELSFFCKNHPIQELQEVFREMQQILNEKK